MGIRDLFRRRTKAGRSPDALVLDRRVDAAGVVYSVRLQTDAGASLVDWPAVGLSPEVEPLSSRHELVLDMLTELVRDEVVERQQLEFVVPFERVFDIPEEMRGLFGLQSEPGWELKVDLPSSVGRGLPVRTRWTTPDGTYAPEMTAVGCGFVDQRGQLHVVPERLARLSRVALQEHGPQVEDEYRHLSDVQQAYRDNVSNGDTAVAFDGQLGREEYVVPDRIELDIRRNEAGGFDLLPRPSRLRSDIAQEVAESPRAPFRFDRNDPDDPSRRLRVVLPEAVRRAFTDVKRVGSIPKERVEEFARDPRSFFPASAELSPAVTEGLAPDTLDLSGIPARIAELDLALFDERVLGVTMEPEVKSSIGQSAHSTDWFGGVKGEGTEEESDASADEGSAPGSKGSRAAQLVTADNDEELNYEAVHSELKAIATTLTEPSAFSGRLKPFQREGYAWLRQLDVAGAGGLLADDMGLGKTVQVISYLTHLVDENRLRPALLVVPSAVAENWKSEIRQFCSTNPRVYFHAGTHRERRKEQIEANDVIITTYDTLSRDQVVLGQIELSALVCDEAQYIKNYTTRRASACRAMQARVRIALTATPVENSLDELWSIVDFCQPGLLDSYRSFERRFVTPLQGTDEAAADSAARELLGLLDGHYLRRTKAGLSRDPENARSLGLPSKTETAIPVEMPPPQAAAYHAMLVGRGAQAPLAALQRLFLVSVHPDMVRLPLEDVLDAAANDPDGFAANSCKLSYLLRELEVVQRAGERAVVFAHRRSVQQVLAVLLRRKFGVTATIINGDVASGARLSIIERFNALARFEVLVLSPLAAGVGLNVTGANHVFHMMRLWNPAKESQATDRCYRIGQTRDVNVHAPMAVMGGLPSVDENLHQLLEAKRGLAEQVIRPTQRMSVSWRELESCLSPNAERTPVHDGVTLPSARATTLPKRGPIAVQRAAVIDAIAVRLQPLVESLIAWGLPLPECGFVLNDETGAEVTRVDLAWPDKRVAVVTEDALRAYRLASDAGWTCYRHPVAPSIVQRRLR